MTDTWPVALLVWNSLIHGPCALSHVNNNNKQETNKLSTTNKWRDINKKWMEYKGKPRKGTVAKFRLKTGPDCPAAHLRNIGNYEFSECTIC
jgi:hypothetical protein